jgi:hypothetical protein
MPLLPAGHGTARPAGTRARIRPATRGTLHEEQQRHRASGRQGAGLAAGAGVVRNGHRGRAGRCATRAQAIVLPTAEPAAARRPGRRARAAPRGARIAAGAAQPGRLRHAGARVRPRHADAAGPCAVRHRSPGQARAHPLHRHPALPAARALRARHRAPAARGQARDRPQLPRTRSPLFFRHAELAAEHRQLQLRVLGGRPPHARAAAPSRRAGEGQLLRAREVQDQRHAARARGAGGGYRLREPGGADPRAALPADEPGHRHRAGAHRGRRVGHRRHPRAAARRHRRAAPGADRPAARGRRADRAAVDCAVARQPAGQGLGHSERLRARCRVGAEGARGPVGGAEGGGLGLPGAPPHARRDRGTAAACRARCIRRRHARRREGRPARSARNPPAAAGRAARAQAARNAA